MQHPLHPQSTNHSTLISKKNPLLACLSPMTPQLSYTLPRLSFPYDFHPLLHSRPSPIDLSPYLLRYKVRPLARPARRTSLGDWSLTRATSSATLNKRVGWLTDPATSGKWGSQIPKGACCLVLTSTPASASPRTLSPTS